VEKFSRSAAVFPVDADKECMQDTQWFDIDDAQFDELIRLQQERKPRILPTQKRRGKTVARGTARKVSRARLQLKGDVCVIGGMWKGRHRITTEDGSRKWTPRVEICHCSLSKAEAIQIYHDRVLDAVNRQGHAPNASMLLADFVKNVFRPQHVDRKTPKGAEHFDVQLRCHIVPALGEKPLRDIKRADVQKLIDDLHTQKLSWQSCKHVAAVIHKLFTFAEREALFTGVNPAKYVVLPPKKVKAQHVPTPDQLNALLGALHGELKWMVLTAATTGLNAAELQGLKLKRVNLSEQTIWDGVNIPSNHLLVVEQHIRNKRTKESAGYTGLKASTRFRLVGIPEKLRPILKAHKERLEFTGPDDPLFVSRYGTPYDTHNGFRTLKRVATKLKMPWLGWHTLRRYAATQQASLGMEASDRVSSMGHADLRMTERYNIQALERRMDTLNKVADQISLPALVKIP
jgi:integrase